LGHVCAIVSDGAGTAAGKREALEAAGVKVGKTPSETDRQGHASCSPAFGQLGR